MEIEWIIRRKKMNQHSNGAGGFGIGILVGAAIGVVVGILFAPRKGSETREMIGEKAMQAKDKAQDVIETVKVKASEMRSRAE
jgi:gas vesicle protein